MLSRTALLASLILAAIVATAEPVAVGDRILLHGEITGCPESEGEYLVVREEILESMKFLASGACRNTPPSSEPIDPTWYPIARLSELSFEVQH